MGDLRHHRPVRQSPGERRRTGGVAEETTPAPPVAGPAGGDAEGEGWRKNPPLPRRSRALTSYPVVRYIGRDDPERTVAGWQPSLDTGGGWLAAGRSPTLLLHHSHH